MTWVGVAIGDGTTLVTTGRPGIGGVAETVITTCHLPTRVAAGMGAETRTTDGKVKVQSIIFV